MNPTPDFFSPLLWRAKRAWTIVSILGLLIILTTLLGFAPILLAQQPNTDEATSPASSVKMFSGVVQDDQGEPIAEALVRLQTTAYRTQTDEAGLFAFENLTVTTPFTLVAWSKGYLFGWIQISEMESDHDSQVGPLTITLKHHHRTDNFDYDWEEAANCGECHTAYAEWQQDAHALSAVNPLFLTMYQGTDIQGNKSPINKLRDGFPDLPDLNQPYYGPGFKTDFPDKDGNCATCHAPQASKLPPNKNCGWSGCHSELTTSRSEEIPPSVNPTGLTGTAAEGISCDFCHKIGNVRVDKETGLPDPEMPGILSLRLYRPEADQQFFFGTVDDVTRDNDSYLPFMSESRFCAGCHFGQFGQTTIYNSYGEWLDSPYSDPETGQTCQDCHMPSLDVERFVFAEKGGLARSSGHVHTHHMPGADDEAYLQNAVSMTTTVTIDQDELLVGVSVINDKTGHHVPTGVPLRQIMLVVEVRDMSDELLTLTSGDVLPDWAGDYRGQPGRGYAKILQDDSTGELPAFSFWRPTTIFTDTRIPALTTDTSHYRFTLPADSPITTVHTRLIYRRAFQQLQEWKDWSLSDIIMEKDFIVIVGTCRKKPCII